MVSVCSSRARSKAHTLLSTDSKELPNFVQSRSSAPCVRQHRPLSLLSLAVLRPSSNDGPLCLWKLASLLPQALLPQLTRIPSDWACRNVPSLPTCNLFFRQLLVHPKDLVAPASELLGLPSNTSTDFGRALSEFGVGVNPACMIPRMAAAGGASGSLGNVANIALCGVSVILAVVLAVLAGRRAAAVGRVEMRILFLMYALVQGAQLVDTGAFLRAGSTALTWVSAVHLGLVVGL